MSRPTSFHLRTQSRPPKLVTRGLLSLSEHLDHIDIIPTEGGETIAAPKAEVSVSEASSPVPDATTDADRTRKSVRIDLLSLSQAQKATTTGSIPTSNNATTDEVASVNHVRVLLLSLNKRFSSY